MTKLTPFKAIRHTSQTKQIPRFPFYSFLITIITILVIAAFFPKKRFNIFDYKINDVTRSSILAPFDFPILKTEKELERDRNEALRQVPLVFAQDKPVPLRQQLALQTFFEELDHIRALKSKLDETKRVIAPRKPEESQGSIIEDSSAFQAALKRLRDSYRIEHKSTILNLLVFETNRDIAPVPTTVYKTLRQILDELYKTPIVDIPRNAIISPQIAIRIDGEELLENAEQVATIEEAWAKAKVLLQGRLNNLPTETISAYYDLLILFIKPNLLFQKTLTEKRQAEAVNKVPLSKGIILENEKIVDANTKITPEIFQKLESLRREQARQADLHSRWRTRIPIVGDLLLYGEQIALVAIICAFFAAFILAYKPTLLQSPRMVCLLAIIFLLQVLFAHFLFERLGISAYAIPITLAAMALTILFDTKIAFMGTITLCLIIGAQIGGSLNFVIVSIFASIFAIFTVRHLRKRNQLFQATIYILIAYCFSIFLVELLKFSTTKEIFVHLLSAGVNALLAPILTYGLIGILEKPFGITTDLTLLELADFNHPLLKLLSREATGTFTHSVTVGNLAEAAADAIGANALLARVGAYYHDIGKISKSEYFIENQAFDYNRHDKLTPNLSAMIIINHVKEGIRLAHEYKLPQAVIDFIPTHHGTTRVEYFYKKALEEAHEPSEVAESDFRYPGPKPHTKETGIVMLCETIEAVCRSLEKPTLATIEKVIDTITDNRLREGQFSECPLTLADFTKIKGNLRDGTGILPILKGIHHLRVEYPGQEEFLSPEKKES
jgi:putative nucleotidyltransferase with HDIG domain